VKWELNLINKLALSRAGWWSCLTGELDLSLVGQVLLVDDYSS